MQYRQFGKLNFKPSLLGFGTMRLPVINGDYSKIDVPEAIRIIRHAIDNGVNYIDTAWAYHKENSEGVVGLALKDGYREKVMLATKSPSWLVRKNEDWRDCLDKQLKRLDTNRIDFYLQHCLNKDFWKSLSKTDFWLESIKAKESGKIKYFGFSFHDDYELFDEIIDAYDWDFCQIQLNYLDTDFQAGLRGLKKAASKNIGVVIMEPLRGGRLATGIPKALLTDFNSFPILRSPVDWALRWLTHMPEVSTILSGMGSFEQVEENIRICSDPDMLPGCMSEGELKLIDDITYKWRNLKVINCTGCQYCMPCPNGVDIPECFKISNLFHAPEMHSDATAVKNYKGLKESKADAGMCVECGACESACPQNIPIINNLKTLHSELDEKK